MRTKILALAALCAFFVGSAASAAIILTLNGYSNVGVSIEPIGLCGSTGNCVFMVTTTGTVTQLAIQVDYTRP